MNLKTLAVIVCVPVVLTTFGCGGNSPTSSSSATVNVPYAQTDLTVGTGRQAAAGNRVTLNYTLWLYSATAADNKGAFQQTSVGVQPLAFVVGTGQVIKGFDQGVTGMAVGGKRRLIVPPSLAYGNTANGAIPANSTLVFEIDLLDVV